MKLLICTLISKINIGKITLLKYYFDFIIFQPDKIYKPFFDVTSRTNITEVTL